MADEEGGAEPQTPDPKPGDGQAPETFDRAYVEELRAESAKYRTERNEARGQLNGFADYEDLKEAAEKWQAQEEEQKGEAEKMQEQITKLQQERDNATERARLALIRSSFVAEASKAGYKNPEDVYHLADMSGVVIGDDGQVSGVDKAVEAVGDRLPKAKPAAPSVDGGAGGAAMGTKAPFTEAEIRQQAAAMNLDPVLLAEQYGVNMKR
jgi:hypothetical protein